MAISKQLRAASSVSSLLALFLFGGCESDGLSPREVQGDDYAAFVSQITQPPPDLGEAAISSQPARQLSFPARIAVAQLGEVAPPQRMLDALRKASKTCSMVCPVNGTVDTDNRRLHRSLAEPQGDQMRRFARDLGADYLFVFGGTVDRSTDDTSLALADVTIIGAFLIPSKQIDVKGTAAGSLIEVGSGRVVLSVSADSHDRRLSPAASSTADELAMLESLRDKLTDQLAQRLVDQAQAVAIAK